MGQAEAKVQKDIINWLTFQGAWVVKTIATNKGGTPDVIACLNGFFIAIEVKQPGGTPSPLQLAQIIKIREADGIAFVADNLDKVKIMLETSGVLK